MFNTLLEALSNDQDLADIAPNLRPQAMQSLYISKGCDYVSFLQALVRLASCQHFPVCLLYCWWNRSTRQHWRFFLDTQSPSMLSFLCLVECAYFRKHSSAFELHTPEALFHSTEGNSMTERHEKWLTSIRRTVWQRADSKGHNVPSTETLMLHWRRSVWITAMWHLSTVNERELPCKLNDTDTSYRACY